MPWSPSPVTVVMTPLALKDVSTLCPYFCHMLSTIGVVGNWLPFVKCSVCWMRKCHRGESTLPPFLSPSMPAWMSDSVEPSEPCDLRQITALLGARLPFCFLVFRMEIMASSLRTPWNYRVRLNGRRKTSQFTNCNTKPKYIIIATIIIRIIETQVWNSAFFTVRLEILVMWKWVI